MKYLLVFVYILSIKNVSSLLNTPVVLWHGMGDSCCFPFSLGAIKKLIENEVNGVYVKSLEIGGSIIRDYESGFFIHPNKQIDEACTMIQNDPELVNGYNAIGFSQGGQFLRAVAQKCPQPPMKNLISLGGQHQGVYGLPDCPSLTKKTCEYFRTLLNHAAYKSWVQKYLVQATYWHDPLNEKLYKEKSTFLSEINNERHVNYTYITNLLNLENLVLVKFLNDTIVQPRESQWFEFYAPGQDKKIIPLTESEIFTSGRLGLNVLMTKGKLKLLSVEGNHLQFTRKWFIENIIPYLKTKQNELKNSI